VKRKHKERKGRHKKKEIQIKEAIELFSKWLLSSFIFVSLLTRNIQSDVEDTDWND
jgi:hypothetical protein